MPLSGNRLVCVALPALRILMDYPIIDSIRIELSILYFKGFLIESSIKLCKYVPEDCFYLGKQYRR